MKCLVQGNIKHNGKSYCKGDIIEISAEESKNLFQAGLLVAVEEKSAVIEDAEGESKMVEPKRRGRKAKEK